MNFARHLEAHHLKGFLTLSTALLLVGLSACSVQDAPQAPSETLRDYDYTLSVDIAADATRAETELSYGGEAIVFRPEAGFAVLGVHGEGLAPLGKNKKTRGVDKNQDTFSAPSTSSDVWSSGFSAWSGGFSAWSGGFSAWSGGFSAWSGGFSAWSGGFSAWSGGFSAWSGGFSAWSGGFSAWSGGELTGTPMDNLDMWLQVGLPEAHIALAPRLGEGVVVAVVDTGVDLDHIALAERLVPGRDFVDDDSLADEVAGGSAYGHGTGVAGLILQVAPRAKIMPLRVLDPNGLGDTDDVAAAIDFAIANGADVINLSLGSAEQSTAVQRMIDYADRLGIYVVASVGNSGLEDAVTYPAAESSWTDRLIGAGSVDLNDTKSAFSNYGFGSELLAPGEGMFTAAPDDRLGYWTGTSFAAPVVAGSLALALAEPAKSKFEELYWNLSDTAETVWMLEGNKAAYGNTIGGRLDLPAFLRQSGLADTSAEFGVETNSVWDFGTNTPVTLRLIPPAGTVNHAHIDPASVTLVRNGEPFTPDAVSLKPNFAEVQVTDLAALRRFLGDFSGAAQHDLNLSFSFAGGIEKSYDFSVEASY